MRFKQYFVFSAICLLAGWLQPAWGQVVIDSIVPVPGCLPSGSFVIFGSGLNNVNSVQFGNVANSASINLTTATAVAGTWSVSPSASTGSTVITVSDAQSTDTLSLLYTYSDPSFSYPSSVCQNEPSFAPISVADTTGPDFFRCQPVGSTQPCDSITMDSVTGVIFPMNSTPGIYAIEHTSVSGNCNSSTTQQIRILPFYQVAFDYPDTAYCENDFPVNPLLNTPDSTGSFLGFLVPGTGLAGGVLNFISSQDGLINFSLSDPGLYAITYTSPNFCSDANDTLRVIENDDASFDYIYPKYCQSEPNPTPVISGFQPGVFSEITNNVVFEDSTTGEINLAASQVGGPYTIRYTTLGICPSIFTDNIKIYTGTDSCSVVGLEEMTDKNQASVYPNPVSEWVNLKFSQPQNETTRVEIFSLNGSRMVSASYPRILEENLDVSGLPSGIYFLKIKSKAILLTYKLSIIH